MCNKGRYARARARATTGYPPRVHGRTLFFRWPICYSAQVFTARALARSLARVWVKVARRAYFNVTAVCICTCTVRNRCTAAVRFARVHRCSSRCTRNFSYSSLPTRAIPETWFSSELSIAGPL